MQTLILPVIKLKDDIDISENGTHADRILRSRKLEQILRFRVNLLYSMRPMCHCGIQWTGHETSVCGVQCEVISPKTYCSIRSTRNRYQNFRTYCCPVHGIHDSLFLERASP